MIRAAVVLQSLHSEVLDPLHELLAIALELPEDYLVNLHKYDVKSEVRLFSVRDLSPSFMGSHRIIFVT